MDLAAILEALGKFLTEQVGAHGKGFIGGVMAFLVFWRWGWPWQWVKRKKKGDD